MNTLLQKKNALVLAAICVLTFICFRYTLQNQFTNWDDDYYVTNDPYIKALTPHNLKIIFTEDITKNNYHPLCMLSLAINYHFSQLEPMAYYLTNIIIHIINVILVFFLMQRLCDLLTVDDKGKLFIASFAAMWFGIHPMHVESVAWIAERKDVLYACFYMQALLTYLQYLKTNKMQWYWITFVLFVASCLSKPMAVVFPMSLLCVDFLAQRQFGKKLITEKILFFLTSLFFGIMAFYTQNKTGAVASFDTLTLAERLMYASYGFVMYISKVFNPTYLSTFYPYPYRYVTGSLPGIYYAAPFLAMAAIAVPLYLTWKKNRTYFRAAVFGIGLFVLNLMFVLQVISVGAAIMADRYSYVAYFGLFFILAYTCYEIVRRLPSFKTAMTAWLLVLSGGLAYLCYERTFAWHNSETLLSDAIAKYPYRALLSYKWLGNYYLQEGQYAKALENYGVLTMLRAADDKVKKNIAYIESISGLTVSDANITPGQPIGNLNAPTGAQVTQSNTAPMGNTGAPQQMQNFNKSTGQAPDAAFYQHITQCLAYTRKGDTTGAFKEYIAAFRVSQSCEKPVADSCFRYVQNQQFDAAINGYGMLLKLHTANPFYYFYRGVAYFSKGEMNGAVSNWEIAVKLNSKDVQQSASYNLSVAYDSLGNTGKAYYYATKAQSLGYTVTPEYLARLKTKSETAPANKNR